MAEKCKGPGGPFCEAMEKHLQPMANSGPGLSLLTMMNLETGESFVKGIYVTRGRGVSGPKASKGAAMLNYCPFCGAHISPAMGTQS